MAKFKITGLPKAQLGKSKVTLEGSPFSINANQTQLASGVYGEYDPEFLIGASIPIGGSDNPRVKNRLFLNAGLPLNGTVAPSINAGYNFRYRPGSLNANAFAPTIQMDITGGWDPTQGFNHQLIANPRWEFMNKRIDGYLKHNWPAGAWRGYAGPTIGWNYRQHSFIPGLAGYDTSEKAAGNAALFAGAQAGIEGRPFRHTPLRVGLDAGIVANTAKKQAEEAFNPSTDFGKSNTGFTPMLKAKVVYPLGTKYHNKKEAEEEKIKIDAARANDKNFIVEAPVMTGPGVDWNYKEKEEQTGIPVGYLPGYEPETGRELSEEELKRRYNYGPTLRDGGASQGMYMDLTDEEIEQYRKGGYIVEELPQAKFGKNKRKGQDTPPAIATSIMTGNMPEVPVQPGVDPFDLNVGTVDHDPLLTAKWNRAQAYENLANLEENLYAQNQKMNEDLWAKQLAEREAKFKAAGKHDALDPLQSIPLWDFEERQKKDPNYAQSLKDQGYFFSVDKDNGKVNLYPKFEIQQRIIKNGLRTDEIVNKLGVGTKEEVEQEFGSVMEGANEMHAIQTQNELQKLMVDKGWSKEKAIDYLVQKGYGTKTALEKIYKTEFNEIDKNVRSWYAYGEDYQPSYLDKDGNMVSGLNLIDRWKDNDIITLARDRRFIDSYGANITSVSPNDNGSLEYGAQVLQKLRSGKWGWNPKTNSLVKLGADDAYKDLAIDPTEEDENEIKRIGDYSTLSNQQFNDKYYAPQSKVEKEWRKGKVPVRITGNDYMATESGQDENGNTAQFYFGIEVPAGTDPNTGEIITKKVPANELVGQTVYMTEEEADRYRRARVQSNMGAVSRNPLWYAPALLGAQPFAGGVLGATMNYAPISSLPWLNLGNVLSADMAYNALRPNGDFEQAGKAWDKGNYESALGHGLWGALGVAPVAGTAFRTMQGLSNLRKPGELVVLPKRGKYSALYKSPINSGLVVGNTNLNTAEPAFTSFTDPLNKFLDKSSKILGRNSFGELKLMKQSPSVTGATPPTQNLLGSGSILTQSLRKPALTLDTEVPLYRVEPNNFVQSTDPYDPQFLEHFNIDSYGVRRGWGKSHNLLPYRNEGALYNELEEPGEKMLGLFYPVHTHGNWWTARKPEVPGMPSVTAPGIMPDNTGLNKLTVGVPFSALDKYHVTKDPKAMEFSGELEGTYILPSKFRKKAKFEDWSAPKSTDIAGAEQTAGTAVKEPLTENGAISLIEDARTEQLGKWQSKEGRKRLSKWIAENPHMKGLTPEDMIKGLEDLKNLNVENQNTLHANALRISDINKEVAEVDLMLETGAINEQQHVSMIMKLEDERNLIEGNSEYIIMQGENYATNGKLGRSLPTTSKSGTIDLAKGEERDATYNILLGLNFTPEEAFVLSRHELQGHYTQRGRKTKMDDELAGLELKESATKPGDGTLFGETNTALAGQDDWLGRNKDFETYFQSAKNYFLNGSKGQEKTAFAAEVRADMLRTGAIKDLYDPITAKNLKAYYDTYAAGGHDVPLRLFDIMEDSNKNFKKLSGLLNRLPVIATALAVGDAMWDEDTKGETKASVGILAAALLGRGRNSKGLGKFINNVSNAFRVGKIRTAANETFVLSKEIEKAKKATDLKLGPAFDNLSKAQWRTSKYTERGVMHPTNPWDNGVNKIEVLMREHPGSTEAKRAKVKGSFWTSDDSKRMTDQQKAKDLQLTNKGEITSTSKNLFTNASTGDPTIKTGTGTVFNFKTGEHVDVSVKVPGGKKTYSKQDGKLVITDEGAAANPSVSQSLLRTLADNVNEVQTIIPGAKVFGSTMGVLEGGLPHLSKDLDLMITEADYNANVKGKFPFVQQFGPAMQHEVKAGVGEQGVLDFNIIHEGADGLVKPTIPITLAHRDDYVPIEMELFRQFFPEEYAKASLESMKKYGMDPYVANAIKIPLTPKQLIDGVDPTVKTIIDAMEATKEKHLLKYDTYLSYGNPDAVAKAQSYYVRGLVGGNGSVGHQFDASAFTDESENYRMLIEINFLGDKDAVIKDPKKMQNALNDFYINNTTYSRQIGLEPITNTATGDVDMNSLLDAFKTWRPDQGGGTVNGIGLNTVKVGNPLHKTLSGQVMGHTQYNLKMDDAAKSNPISYIKEIKRQTHSEVPFSPEDQKIVDDLHQKYGVDKRMAGKTMEEVIADSGRMIDWKQQSQFLTELGKQLNIRAVTRHSKGYGTSVYSSSLNSFDETLDGLMISFYKHAAKPKSYEQRVGKAQNIIAASGNNGTEVINTLNDFNKFEALLTGGIQKANERMRAVEAYRDAVLAEKRAFAKRAVEKKQADYDALEAEYRRLSSEFHQARQDYDDLINLQHKAENYRAIIVIGGTMILGAVGIASAQREKWADEQELYDKISKRKKAEYLKRKNKGKIRLERKLGGATDKLLKFIG